MCDDDLFVLAHVGTDCLYDTDMKYVAGLSYLAFFLAVPTLGFHYAKKFSADRIVGKNNKDWRKARTE
jgi:hypothetical protein